MVSARKWIYAKRAEGEIQESNFQTVTEELPALQDGGKRTELIVLL